MNNYSFIYLYIILFIEMIKLMKIGKIEITENFIKKIPANILSLHTKSVQHEVSVETMDEYGLSDLFDDKIKSIIDFENKDEKCILMFRSVPMHTDYGNDNWNYMNGYKSYFLQLTLQGKGIVNAYHNDRISKSIHIEKGDIWLLNPMSPHSYKLLSNEFTMCYSMNVSKKIRI